MHDRVLGVAGREKHLQLRPQLPRAASTSWRPFISGMTTSVKSISTGPSSEKWRNALALV